MELSLKLISEEFSQLILNKASTAILDIILMVECRVLVLIPVSSISTFFIELFHSTIKPPQFGDLHHLDLILLFLPL